MLKENQQQNKKKKKADDLAALVHVEQHRVPLILRHVHAGGQHTGAVAVQPLVGDSYSLVFCHCIRVLCRDCIATV